MTYIVLWFVIGYVGALGFCKVSSGEVLLADLFIALLLSALGPLSFLLFLMEWIDKSGWGKKRLF